MVEGAAISIPGDDAAAQQSIVELLSLRKGEALSGCHDDSASMMGPGKVLADVYPKEPETADTLACAALRCCCPGTMMSGLPPLRCRRSRHYPGIRPLSVDLSAHLTMVFQL